MANKMVEVTFKAPNGNITTRRAHGAKSTPSLKIARSIIKHWPSKWEYVKHEVVKEW